MGLQDEQTEKIEESPAPPVGGCEKLLVGFLAITLCLCVFVSLPDPLTALNVPARRAARSYLRTLGLDQFWRMFVGDNWNIPQLRVLASYRNGQTVDVTRTMMKTSWLYSHILDERLISTHFSLARGNRQAVFPYYAQLLKNRLGPEVQEIVFEAAYRKSPVAEQRSERTSEFEPIASFRWD